MHCKSVSLARCLRGPQASAAWNIVQAVGKGCREVAGMAVTNLLYRVAGLCRGLDFQDEERPSQQHRTPILLAERLPTLTERMHEAEEAAGQLIVKLVVQTALTKAVEAHNKAAGARALAEIQEQHEQHLQAQQELSALRHMWQQHEQQLQERHAAALTEASEQRSQQLQHHTLEHAQALTKVQQQHEQEIAQLQLEHGLAVEQAEATSAGQLQQLQVQHEHVLSQLRDQHTAQLAWLEKKWSDAQRAAVEAAQADTEARLSQQERVHEQALAEQHTGLSEQGKQEVEELKQQLADLQADLQLQRSKTFEVAIVASYFTHAWVVAILASYFTHALVQHPWLGLDASTGWCWMLKSVQLMQRPLIPCFYRCCLSGFDTALEKSLHPQLFCFLNSFP